MPKYEVTLVAYATISVTAENEDEAVTLAAHKANHYGTPDWEAEDVHEEES